MGPRALVVALAICSAACAPSEDVAAVSETSTPARAVTTARVAQAQSLSLFLTLIVTPLAFHAVEALRARAAIRRETAPATA